MILGKCSPTRHIAVQGSQGAQAQAAQALVAREDECRALTRQLSGARKRGAVVVIEGPPGIGKTRLLNWTQGAARGCGFRVLSARGDELEREYPFGVLMQLLGPGWSRQGFRERSLPGPEALDEPSLDMPENPEEPSDPSFARLNALYRLFVNLTRHRPMLAVVDDAHCADSASLRFLNFLARRVVELPLMLVVGRRVRDPRGIPGQLAALSRHPRSHRVQLSPLSESASDAFVRSRAGADAADEFCAACHRATAGNPFFLGALVDDVMRRDLPTSAATARQVHTLAPDNVVHALLLRLSQLSPAAKALAEATAVLGDGVELRLAERLAGLSHPAASRAAEALTDADFFRRASRLHFVYPIVRGAIYSELSPHARSDLHIRAARILDADHVPIDLVAGHLLATEPIGERWLVQALRSAARDATRRNAPDCAATYLRRALSEPLNAEERADVLLELAASEPATSPHMVEHAREALTLAGLTDHDTGSIRVHAIRLVTTGLLMCDRDDEALAVLSGVIDELEHESDRELRLSLVADLAALANCQPRLGALLGVHLDRFESELSGATSAERRLLGMLAYRKAQVPAPAEHAVRLAERALSGRRLLADGIKESSASLLSVGTALGLAGRSAMAERLLTDLIDQARLTGLPTECAAARVQRAAEHYRCGALDDARRDIKHALEVGKSQPWHPMIQDGIATLVRIMVEQGALDTAEQVLGEWELGGELPETLAGTQLLIARGSLRLAQHRPREALAELDAAGRREAGWGGRSIALEWRNAAALTHRVRGDYRRALELAHEDLEIAQIWGAQRRLGIALGTLGLIEGGEAGIERLHDAVRVLEGSVARLEHARALVNLGAMLRRAGQPSDARTFLKAGLERALQCRASVLVADADEELAATGVRRRRRTALSGTQELTPSERRIAAMAADGLSNPEIAQALFITRKTVEMHLGNVYRKLAIESREQLPATLATEAESARRGRGSFHPHTAFAGAAGRNGHIAWRPAEVI